MICHKCLVSVDNFEEFKDQCQENDKKLRLLFNIPVFEIQEVEAVPPEDISMLPNLEGHQIILLDPSKLYESSDSENENGDVETEEQIADKPEMINDSEVIQVLSDQIQEQEQVPLIQPPPIPIRKEAFHCNYCDIAFSDPLACSEHEQNSHDPQYPFTCGLPNCNFKCDNRNSLVIHIKEFHHLDRPFVCVQCNKTFVRRSDLKKHAFVHSGIRSFVCDICSKSFTRNTNLTKHKRIHSDVRGFKCNLCPNGKGFVNKSDLTRHLEIHMDRRSLVCKYCNKTFNRRDKLLLHQKSHTQCNGIPVEQQIVNPPVNQSVVYYNQPVDNSPSVSQATPLNFYTENMIINLDPYNENHQPQLASPITTNFMIYQCDKCIKTFPSMILLQSHQDVHLGIKNFLCTICNKGYVRKKELDRHMMTSHSDKSYDCSQCNKKFKRKDKLVRHERSHQVEKFFNCPLCPAVFIRRQMLESHSKVHELNNGVQQLNGQLMFNSENTDLKHDAGESNGVHSQEDPMILQNPMDYPTKEHPPEPVNLSFDRANSEPMDLSNDRTETEPSLEVEVLKNDIPDQLNGNSQNEIMKQQQHTENNLNLKRSISDIPKTPEKSLPDAIVIISNGNKSPKAMEQNDDVIEIIPIQNDVTIVKNEIMIPMHANELKMSTLEPIQDLPHDILQQNN